MRKLIYTLVAACAIGSGAAALGVTSASAVTPLVAPVTATTSVSAHPDTTSPTGSGTACKSSPGGPVWALDAFTRQMTAINTAVGTWRVTIQDNGSFAGFADPVTCAASLSDGNFNQDYTVSVSSPVNPSAAFLHSSYSGAISTTQMLKDFFDDAIGVAVTGGDYFAVYQNAHYVQTGAVVAGLPEIYGDVTPAPAPVLSLAFCGNHVWRVTQNASLVATKFHYFSKVGTSYLLDGAATVASGGSVKVTERPRAVGGMEIRYPSAGKTITLFGSRTLVAC